MKYKKLKKIVNSLAIFQVEAEERDKKHNKKMKKLDEKHDEKMKKLDEKHDEKMKKLDEKHDEKMKKLDEKHDEKMKKLDEEIKELDKEIKKSKIDLDNSKKETDRKLRSMGVQLGNISNNQGDVTEEFFVNSLGKDLKVAGVQYDEMYKNMYKRTKQAEGEFDIVLINGKDIAIIETKYKLHLDDLDDLLNRKFNNFKKLYPKYSDYNYHLGLASFHIYEDIKEKALKSNIFILQRKGDIIESFLPK